MRRELQIAFRSTSYRVFTGTGELLLRVDQTTPALRHLLQTAQVRCAALLTAFNPGGRRQPAFRNRRSQLALRAELQGLGYRLLEGRNEDPRGRWPVEPTFLVLGLPLADAQHIAASHGQAALLWMQTDGLPRLIDAAACFTPGAMRPTPRRYRRTRPAA